VVDDGVKREVKSIVTLENGSKYSGEWLQSQKIRDGRGI
jgi:hypothetical protein